MDANVKTTTHPIAPEDWWWLAEELEARHPSLQTRPELDGLLALMNDNLGMADVTGSTKLRLKWRCSFSTKHASDLRVVLTPTAEEQLLSWRVTDTKVVLLVEEQGSVATFDLGNLQLERIWEAFKSGVLAFVARHKDALRITQTKGEWVEFDKLSNPMRCTVTVLNSLVDVLPVLCTDDLEHWIPKRQCSPSGSNVVRLPKIPVHCKTTYMIGALEHVVKVVHRSNVPRYLLEAVVREVLNGHCISHACSVADISFELVWGSCLQYLSQIAEESGNELFAQLDEDDKQGLRLVLQRYATCDSALVSVLRQAPEKSSTNSSSSCTCTAQESASPLSSPPAGFLSAVITTPCAAENTEHSRQELIRIDRRVKVSFVGDSLSGKTTLITRLISPQTIGFPRQTTWIQRQFWHPPQAPEMTFDLWDFPGQAEHYATHNLFLSDWRSVYVLVCNISRLNWESRLQYWVSFLRCKSSFVVDQYRPQDGGEPPTFTVLVIGTHFDRITAPHDNQLKHGLQLFVDDLTERHEFIQFVNVGPFDLLAENLQLHDFITCLVSCCEAMPLFPAPSIEFLERTLTQLEDLKAPGKPLITSFGSLRTTAMRQLSDQQAIETLKMLHSLGEVVWMPPLSSQPDLEEHSPVVLSFNWLLEKIGDMFEDRTKHDFALGVSPAELAWVWGGISLAEANGLLEVLKRMLLCHEVGSRKYLFPLLLPKSNHSDTQKVISEAGLVECVWLRSEGDIPPLPPGAFGMIQVRFSELRQQKSNNPWKDVELKNYLHETIIRVNTLPHLVVSFHNPSLTLDPFSDFSAVTTSIKGAMDSMISVMRVGQGRSTVGLELWDSVITVIKQMIEGCSKYSPVKVKEEVPCLACIRDRCARGAVVSVCRIFSKDELNFSDEHSKFTCATTGMPVPMWSLIDRVSPSPSCESSLSDPPPILPSSITVEEQTSATEENGELWDLSQTLMAPEHTSACIQSEVESLKRLVSTKLSDANFLNLGLHWDCALQVLGDGFLCIPPSKVDAVIIATPSIAGCKMHVNVDNNCCTFAGLSKPTNTSRFILGEKSLCKAWTVFCDAVKEFAETFAATLRVRVDSPDSNDPVPQISHTLNVNSRPLRLSLAFQAIPDILIFLCQRTNPVDGSKTYTPYPYHPPNGTSLLPPQGRQLVCVIKYLTDVILQVDTPPGFFESIVLQEFTAKGWLSGGAVTQSSITFILFINVWRGCWNRILGVAASPAQALELISPLGKSKLLDYARQFAPLADESLLKDKLQELLRSKISPPEQVRNPLLSDWLSQIGLAQYLADFQSNGYHDIQSILVITEADLREIGVSALAHRKKFVLEANVLRSSTRLTE